MNNPTFHTDNLSDLIDVALSPLDSFIQLMYKAYDGHESLEVAGALMDHAKIKIHRITGFVDQKLGRITLISAANDDDNFMDVRLAE